MPSPPAAALAWMGRKSVPIRTRIFVFFERCRFGAKIAESFFLLSLSLFFACLYSLSPCSSGREGRGRFGLEIMRLGVGGRRRGGVSFALDGPFHCTKAAYVCVCV